MTSWTVFELAEVVVPLVFVGALVGCLQRARRRAESPGRKLLVAGCLGVGGGLVAGILGVVFVVATRNENLKAIKSVRKVADSVELVGETWGYDVYRAEFPSRGGMPGGAGELHVAQMSFVFETGAGIFVVGFIPFFAGCWMTLKLVPARRYSGFAVISKG